MTTENEANEEAESSIIRGKGLRPTGVAHHHDFVDVVPAGAPGETLLIDDLHRVRLQVSADLGQCILTVREVLELRRGAVIPLDKLAGEMSDVYVNGLPLARGEVFVIGDLLTVRIGEIVGDEDKKEEDEAEDEYNDEDY